MKLHQIVAGALAAAFAILLGTGCSSKPNSSDVVAQVNSKKILRSEVEKYYTNQTAGAPQSPSPEQGQALRLNILRRTHR